MSYFVKRWLNSNKEQRLKFINGQVKFLWVNKELIDFLENIVKSTKSVDERIFYIQYCRKIILQNERKPQQNHFEAFREEYLQDFKRMKREQKENEPIKWIEAELHHLEYLKATCNSESKNEQKLISANGKDWLTFDEMLSWLNISKSTLQNRIAEGMPREQIGKRWRYSPKRIEEWMRETRI